MQINNLFIGIFCLLSTASVIHSAAIHAPLSLISLDDISPAERSYLQAFSDHMKIRNRRSGSLDIISPIKQKIASGVKSKIGLIAQGSSAVLSHIGKGSSVGGDSHHHYDVPHSYDEKAFDIWALKKSILSTLLQAAKAIKGGVLAVKGQLIKGGGQLISAKGRFISNKGEAITNIGKSIATSALLVPAKGGEEHHYEHPPVYGAPSGHGDFSSSGLEYGAPPNNEYLPTKYHSSYEDREKAPYGSHAGVIILKKIPSGHGHHIEHEAPIPDFKPLKSSSSASFLPKVKDLVGSIFKASAGVAASASSAAFKASSAAVAAGSTAAVGSLMSSSSGGHEHHDSIQESIDYHAPPQHHSHDYAQYEHYDEYQPYASSSEQKEQISQHTSYRSNNPTHPPPVYMASLSQNSQDVKNNQVVKIPATSYGVPIFKHLKEQQQDSAFAAQNLINVPTALGNPPEYLDQLKNFNSQFPQLFIGMNLPLVNTDFDVNPEFTTIPPYNGGNQDLVAQLNNQLHQQQSSVNNIDIDSGHDMLSQASEHPVNTFAQSEIKHVSKKHVNDKPFFLPTPTTNLDSQPSIYNSFSDKSLAPNPRAAPIKKAKKPSFDIVRSVTYELGPNGPIKL